MARKLTKAQMDDLISDYEMVILNVAADLQDGEKPEKIYYRIYKNMQRLSSKYSNEVI